MPRFRTPMAFAASLALVAGPLPAQQAGPRPADVIINMRDLDIADVAQQISRITGRTIILDPAVQGTVTVTSASPLTSSGAWELFVSVMRGQGYAVVRNGRAWRVVSQQNAAREPSGGGTAQVTTRLIRLNTLSPEAAARIFRPLVNSFGSVEPSTNPNAIVVTDYADNVARVAALAQSLDRGGTGVGFATIELQAANATDVASAITSILGGEGSGATAVGDERSSTVIVRGSRTQIDEARRIARALDKPNGAAPVLRVFRLRYNDAESVAQVLAGILGGQQAANNPVAQTLQGTGISGTGLASGGLSSLGGLSGVDSAGLAGLGAVGGLGVGANTSVLGSRGLGTTRNRTATQNPSVGFQGEDIAIQSSPELNAIVVRGAPAMVAKVEELITELDVRRPQVTIEAAIVEVTGDQAEQLGIQLGLGPAAGGFANVGATSFSNLGLPLRNVLAVLGIPAANLLGVDGATAAIGSDGDFGLLLQALGTSSRANLLSTPSITVLDNEVAEIVVGQNVPFVTGSYLSGAVTATPFTTIERADVGITLRVVPRIHEGNTVRLEVSQEVSSLVGAVGGAADIVTNRRAINTMVLADDAQTIVLGGLISDDQLQSESKVPLLGDIPIVGNLFKSRRVQKTRRTLFVFLKPTILRDPAAVSAVSAAKYNRLRGAEAELYDRPRSLLLDLPQARLPAEIDGVY